MEADERRKRWEEKTMRRKSRGEENWEQKGLEQREQESFQTVICRPHTQAHTNTVVYLWLHSTLTHINFLETYFNLNYDYYLPNPHLNPTLLYPSHLYVKLDWFKMHWFDFCPHKEGMSPAWVMLGHTHTHLPLYVLLNAHPHSQQTRIHTRSRWRSVHAAPCHFDSDLPPTASQQARRSSAHTLTHMQRTHNTNTLTRSKPTYLLPVSQKEDTLRASWELYPYFISELVKKSWGWDWNAAGLRISRKACSCRWAMNVTGLRPLKLNYIVIMSVDRLT